jgi:hypothetical protein
VATQDGTPGKWAIGRDLTRPILAHVGVVTLGLLVFYAVEEVRQGGDLIGPVVAAGTLLRNGLRACSRILPFGSAALRQIR